MKQFVVWCGYGPNWVYLKNQPIPFDKMLSIKTLHV